MRIETDYLKSVTKRLYSDVVIISPSSLSVRGVELSVRENITLVDSTFAVDRQAFCSVINRCGKSADINLSGSRLIITSGRARFELSTTVSDPIEIQVPDSPCVKLSSGGLKQVLEFTSQVCDNKQISAFSPGALLLEAKDGILKSVGTDGYRIAIAEVKMACSNFRLILPLKVAEALATLSGEIKVQELDNTVVFSTDSTVISARKPAISFPGFEHVIPASFDIEAQVLSKDVKESLKICAPLKDESKKITLRFGARLKMIKAEGGRIENELDYIGGDREPLAPEHEINLNHSHLQEFFNKLDCPVDIKNKTNGPVLLQAGNLKLVVASMR